MKPWHHEQLIKYRVMKLRTEAGTSPARRESAINYMKKALVWCRMKGWLEMVRHISISIENIKKMEVEA
ncbi:hypothetical protein LJC71_04815 [Desulfosarcina sp. OttesenSCG-928-A07]|nr:hypothetical protein [Desulfosarcina sp. OttesenSCG-928-G17]MDL2329059.1 hypothetical protein [Desulfosarcina sp. OttesenSCG-928-A07]